MDLTQVFNNLDSLLTRLLQNLRESTWHAREQVRIQAAHMASNLHEQFVALKTLERITPTEYGTSELVQPVASAPQQGSNIFIGHGRSLVWRELKDFIQDRLNLPWNEFNKVSVAGTTVVDRLNQMLNDAGMAFLILTAEDERLDGQKVARQNVVHEAGLFQARLGFGRAIVLLEDGCEEFSNIAGLNHIGFPAGRIDTVFEKVRTVLEREGFRSA